MKKQEVIEVIAKVFATLKVTRAEHIYLDNVLQYLNENLVPTEQDRVELPVKLEE